MRDTATHLADVGRAVDHAARAQAFARQADGFVRAVDVAVRAEALGRRIDAAAKAHARAAEIGRRIDGIARATGQDPAGFVVLVPGSPEHARAERDLMRARAL